MQNAPPAVLHLTSRNEVRVRELTIRTNTLCLITCGTKYLLQNDSSRLRYNTNSLLMLHQGSTIDIINEPPLGGLGKKKLKKIEKTAADMPDFLADE